MTRHVRDITTSNRVKKVVRKQGAVFSSRVYIDGVFEHLTEAAGQQNTIHLMDQRSRMATIRLGNALGDTTPAIKYELENNLNSSIVLLDVNGTVVNTQEYFPFGETSFGSYGKKRYQYTGKERDEETALYYYGARYYHTTLCRFVSVDPLAQKFADLSPYNYAGNKPIAKVDIDGLQEEGRPGTQQSSGDGEAMEGDASESSGSADNSNSSQQPGIEISVNPLPNSQPIRRDGDNMNASLFKDGAGKMVLIDNDAKIGDDKTKVTASISSDSYLNVEGVGLVSENLINSDYITDQNKSTTNGEGGYVDTLDHRTTNQWSNWLNTTDNIFSVAGVGGEVKTEMIEYVVRSNYKTATSRTDFNKLRPSQQAWRTTNTLGRAGASYLKFFKGLGVAGNVIGVTSASVKLIENPTRGNATRLAVQGAAIGAAFIPVVGWGLSLSIAGADLIWGDDFYNWIDRQ